MKPRNKIVIYNIETNNDSKILAAALYWIKGFANIYEEVVVYSVHVGNFNLPENVSVFELGGGKPTKKIIAIARLLKSIILLVPKRKSTVVFHHMSSKTAGTVGLIIRMLGIPQGLWYSHSIADPYLKISRFWVNAYFSATPSSFPLETTKVTFTGHGIPTDKFSSFNIDSARAGVVSIGRIVRVKNIEEGIDAIALSSIENKELNLYGEPIEADNYVEVLKKVADSKNVKLNFHGYLDYDSMPSELQKYSVIYSGTPKSTDKALLEAATAGCFPLTTNQESDKLTGMLKVWSSLEVDPNASLKTKLSVLTKLSENQKKVYRKEISLATCASSDVNVTVSKISNILRKY